MLAATQDQQRDSLELVRLALSMVQSGDKKIPESLKDYFSKVLQQARVLAADPSKTEEDILPEAIDLALEIRSVEEFSRELKNVEDVDNLAPEIAGKLLFAMEKRPVYSN